MAGRPYRSGEGGFETAELGALTLTDDEPLFLLHLTHPDVLAEDVLRPPAVLGSEGPAPASEVVEGHVAQAPHRAAEPFAQSGRCPLARSAQLGVLPVDEGVLDPRVGQDERQIAPSER